MAIRIYVLDGGGPKDSENTLISFLTKCGEKVFRQIGADIWCDVWYELKATHTAKQLTIWTSRKNLTEKRFQMVCSLFTFLLHPK